MSRSRSRPGFLLSSAIFALLGLLGWMPALPVESLRSGAGAAWEKSQSAPPASELGQDLSRKSPQPWVPTLDLLQPEGWHLALVFGAPAATDSSTEILVSHLTETGRGRGPPADGRAA